MKRYILAGAALLVTFVVLSRGASTKSAPFPDPALDDQLAPASSQRSVVVAGG